MTNSARKTFDWSVTKTAAIMPRMAPFQKDERGAMTPVNTPGITKTNSVEMAATTGT
jgi:hypothetical protein